RAGGRPLHQHRRAGDLSHHGRHRAAHAEQLGRDFTAQGGLTGRTGRLKSARPPKKPGSNGQAARAGVPVSIRLAAEAAVTQCAPFFSAECWIFSPALCMSLPAPLVVLHAANSRIPPARLAIITIFRIDLIAILLSTRAPPRPHSSPRGT